MLKFSDCSYYRYISNMRTENQFLEMAYWPRNEYTVYQVGGGNEIHEIRWLNLVNNTVSQKKNVSVTSTKSVDLTVSNAKFENHTKCS
jgi:hypothetical protein